MRQVYPAQSDGIQINMIKSLWVAGYQDRFTRLSLTE